MLRLYYVCKQTLTIKMYFLFLFSHIIKALAPLAKL